jgi:hypothetical protein
VVFQVRKGLTYVEGTTMISIPINMQGMKMWIK